MEMTLGVKIPSQRFVTLSMIRLEQQQNLEGVLMTPKQQLCTAPMWRIPGSHMLEVVPFSWLWNPGWTAWLQLIWRKRRSWWIFLPSTNFLLWLSKQLLDSLLQEMINDKHSALFIFFLVAESFLVWFGFVNFQLCFCSTKEKALPYLLSLVKRSASEEFISRYIEIKQGEFCNQLPIKGGKIFRVHFDSNLNI